jgi:hypothetical protein
VERTDPRKLNPGSRVRTCPAWLHLASLAGGGYHRAKPGSATASGRWPHIALQGRVINTVPSGAARPATRQRREKHRFESFTAHSRHWPADRCGQARLASPIRLESLAAHRSPGLSEPGLSEGLSPPALHAQRLARDEKTSGSNPPSPTRCRKHNDVAAQEHLLKSDRSTSEQLLFKPTLLPAVPRNERVLQTAI